MNILILLLLWLGFPTLVLVSAVAQITRLKKQRLHDLILYRFCSVRDKIALKAAAGEISEESEIFNFFYVVNASLIHNHRKSGICFEYLAKSVLGKTEFGSRRQPMSAQTKRLFRQLKHADEDTKQIAGEWIQGCAAMMEHAARGMLVERTIWRVVIRSSDFYRWLAKQIYVPQMQRQTANFISGLARAANVSPEFSMGGLQTA